MNPIKKKITCNWNKLFASVLSGLVLASLTAAGSGLIRTYTNEANIKNIYLFLADIKNSLNRIEQKVDQQNKELKNEQ
jgi:hypothetical protein